MPTLRQDVAAFASPDRLAARYVWAPYLPPDWFGDALCAQVDPEPWFPEKGGSTREAKKVCAACPVRDTCLEHALDHGIRFGVWGGMSERERRKIERERRKAVA